MTEDHTAPTAEEIETGASLDEVVARVVAGEADAATALAPAPELTTGAAVPLDYPGRTTEPTEPHPADEPEVDLDDPSLYVNQELALLGFQERVLEEAEDPRNPLLERAKFLAIFSSNLSEFYMVRVAGLKQQIRAGVSKVSPDGLTPAETLAAVRTEAEGLMERGRIGYIRLRDELAENGIHLLDYADLDEPQREMADDYFESSVFPVLTPLAFDPGRPFPHISNLSLNLAVLVRTQEGEERFARVKIPKALPRLVPICPPMGAGAACESSGSREHHFVWLEQLVAAHMDTLFPGLKVLENHAFRVVRDAEMAIQELEADDLLETIEEGVRRRRFGSVVRCTVTPDMPRFLRSILIENLEMTAEDLVTVEPPLGMSDLFGLYGLDRPDLKYEPFIPAMPAGIEDLDEVDLFAAIRERDILMHRPYDSFEPVVRLLQQAAHDRHVLAIKMTLYRVGRNSPIVHALLDAAREGKEVTVLVELKARFDEESNIEWAKALEAEGVHVVYGLVGLKTHSKILLIVRREAQRIKRYLHLGTGNYNVWTATQYTDMDLLTCFDGYGADATTLFNFLTGYGTEVEYEHFLVAPKTIRTGLQERIKREIEHARAGRGGRMILKMNALVDRRLARSVYEAAAAGVQIDLIVRSMCMVRPGIPGLTENVRVRSIVGRFLEHTRIYYFENAGDPECLIGSADWMPRNLDRRVEVVAPVRDPGMVERIRDGVLAVYLADDVKARRMLTDGTYQRVFPGPDAEPVNAQEILLALAQQRHAK
jgi:polyphosphate kinase